MSTIQRCRTCLLLAALFIIGSRSLAQSTAADQNFKTIPQQIKTNAEVKATNRANTIADRASDKIDSGMGMAYRGLIKMFKKKNKPGGAGVPLKDSAAGGGTVAKDSALVVTQVQNSTIVTPPVKDSVATRFLP